MASWHHMFQMACCELTEFNKLAVFTPACSTMTCSSLSFDFGKSVFWFTIADAHGDGV